MPSCGEKMRPVYKGWGDEPCGNAGNVLPTTSLSLTPIGFGVAR